MEPLYSQVVDTLISIGYIGTLAALWKEISYVPSLHWLRDKINFNSCHISEILSIQFPQLKTIDWTGNNIPQVDFSLNIYGKTEQLDSKKILVASNLDPFIKLVSIYDYLLIINLITEHNCEKIIRYLVNNRRRASKFLKMFLF